MQAVLNGRLDVVALLLDSGASMFDAVSRFSQFPNNCRRKIADETWSLSRLGRRGKAWLRRAPPWALVRKGFATRS